MKLHFDIIIERRDRATVAIIAVGVEEIKVLICYVRLCVCSGEIKLWIMIFRAACVSLPPKKAHGARARRRAAQRVASSSKGLLYMNYDDAAAPSAVISLWICWTLLAHWLKTHPPFVRERLRWPFLFLYWHSVMHIASGDAQTVIFRHGAEISRANEERSHRTFGMQIRLTVVCKRTYATDAV